VPFKAQSLRRRGKYLRFCGKTIRVCERERFAAVRRFRDGCFAQDAVGEWWLCLAVAVEVELTVAPQEEVGIDLGLRQSAVTSEGERLEEGRYYRRSSMKATPAAPVQRAGPFRAPPV